MSTSSLEVARLNDNSVVTIENNAYGIELVENAKRWIRGKGRGNITQPAMIAACKLGMGNADLLPRFIRS